MRLTRLATLAVVGILAASCAATALAAAAGPRVVPPARCTADSGTLVAVDFAHWGGPIVRGCATGGGSAAALLHAVGITTAGDEHDGPAFVCRLGDGAFRHGAQYPTAAAQSCVNTPSATAYWSSWLAPAGASRFGYSQLGATAEPDRPGEVQLWTFGATDIAGTSGSGVPRFGPAELRAPMTRLGGTRIVDAVAGVASTSSGSALPLVIGGCLVLALAGGAAVATRRRRRDA